MDTVQPLPRPFPLSPADAPRRASSAVCRALLRGSTDPDLIVALVIAALLGGDGGALEVRVTAPGRGFPLMTLAVGEAQAGEAVDLALACCQEVDGFEIRVRRLVPGPG